MTTRTDELARWRQCIQKCFDERVALERFERFARRLDRHHVVGEKITETLLDLYTTSRSSDPLLIQYCQCLLRLGCIQGHHVLQTLLNKRHGRSKQHHSSANTIRLAVEAQDSILRLVATTYGTHQRPKSQGEALQTLRAISQWMSALYEASLEENQQLQELGNFHPTNHAIRGTIAAIFLDVVNNEHVKHILNADLPSDLKDLLPESLSKYITLMSGWSPQLAQQLTIMQHSYRSLSNVESAVAEMAHDSAVDLGELELSGIAERLPAHGRASLLVYLDSLLWGMPHASTEPIVQYLQARYGPDARSLVMNLVIASFDLVMLAANRGDSADQIFLIRSFLVNRVPQLIIRISSSLYGYASTSYSVLEAIHRINPNIQLQDGFEAGFSLHGPHTLQAEVMPDFLSSCLLYNVIDREQANRVIDGNAYQKALRVKLDKRTLLQDAQNKPEVLDELIRGLDSMDGDVGARAEAIAEILRSRCTELDTMRLRPVCFSLVKKWHYLDSLFLFTDSNAILQPLCELIDRWTFDADEAVIQAQYEEFSICLTLLLSIIHRFGLHTDYLPLVKQDSWIRWFLTTSGSETDIAKLSATQNDLLGDWVRALFETEGIKDELLARCSPQDFYKIVPALVGQILTIHHQGLLPKDKLRNGYDLLQNTIVLPSLVLGLRVVIDRALRHDAQLLTVLDSLKRLSCPTSSTDEHTVLQHALKTTGSELLERFEQHAQTLHPNNESISSFFQHQVPKSSCRTLTRFPLETLSRNRDAISPSMLRQLSFDFDRLCSWGALDSTSALPPYSHQSLMLSVQCCGAAGVLKSLVNQILRQAASAHSGNDDIPLDVATSIICAYELSARDRGRAHLGLLQALRLERKNAAKLIAKDAQRAEILVHLHRSVESQLASPEQIAHLHRGLPPILNQDPLPGGLENLTQDVPMLDFVDQAHGFDTNMDMDFNSQAIFADSGPQELDSAQGPIDFPQSNQQQQLQQVQRSDLGFQAQQQQVDDLFNNVDASSNSFFGQQNMMEGSFFGSNEEQQQTQQQAQQAQQQLPDASALDDAQDQMVPMDDDDFWASLGVNNDY